MIILDQRDAKWGKIEMKPSKMTLSRAGCTAVSICMLSDYYGCFTLPSQAVDVNIKFNRDGYIIWQELNFPTFKFEGRVYGADFFRIDQSLKDPKRACILNIANGGHWVVALRRLPFNHFWIADPLGGVKRIIKAEEIVGSSHFISK